MVVVHVSVDDEDPDDLTTVPDELPVSMSVPVAAVSVCVLVVDLPPQMPTVSVTDFHVIWNPVLGVALYEVVHCNVMLLYGTASSAMGFDELVYVSSRLTLELTEVPR